MSVRRQPDDELYLGMKAEPGEVPGIDRAGQWGDATEPDAVLDPGASCRSRQRRTGPPQSPMRMTIRCPALSRCDGTKRRLPDRAIGFARRTG